MSPATITQTISFPWKFVTSLFWDRYPNPYSKHVLCEDVLERKMLPGYRLYTKRLLVKQGFGKLPLWLRKALSGSKEMVVEESLIDLCESRLDTVTRNIGALRKYATVVEYTSYQPDASSPSNRTSILRSLSVECTMNVTIRSPLIYYLNHRYRSTAKSSLLGYIFICDRFNELQKPQQQQQCPTSGSRISEHTHHFIKDKPPRVVMADTGPKCEK